MPAVDERTNAVKKRLFPEKPIVAKSKRGK
jgi:hypothetical protein